MKNNHLMEQKNSLSSILQSLIQQNGTQDPSIVDLYYIVGGERYG